MNEKEIKDLEEKILNGDLEPSQIQKKKHSKFGVVLTKNRATIALIGAIVATLGLLGLNAVNFMGIQSATGLLGSSSWGAIFGNGTSYAIKGILSAICESTAYAAAAGALSLTPNAIRSVINRRQYNKLSTTSTENIINKIAGRTPARDSYFVKAQDARREVSNTTNLIQKLTLRNNAHLDEDMVNRAIVTLIERLNTLSLEKKNNWTKNVLNRQGILVPKTIDAAEQVEKEREMKMIQTFLADILDKSDKRDPYYACIKHSLKKYYKTIELISLPKNNEQLAEFYQNDIADPLKNGEINKALKNFCTYSKWISLTGAKTGLTATYDANQLVLDIYEAELKARESTERIKGIELRAIGMLEEIEKSQHIAKAGEIEALGSAERIQILEERFTKVIENANGSVVELRKLITMFTQLKNDAQKELNDILYRSILSKKHANEIKNILTNCINDRTAVKNDVKYIKNAKKQVQGLLKQANAEHLFDDLERLIDLAWISEHQMAVISANVKESKKLVGRTGNELGKARAEARMAHTAAESATESANEAEGHKNRAYTAANSADTESKKATAFRKRAEGEAAIATIITSRMNKTMQEQKAEGEEHLADMAEKRNKANSILEEMEAMKLQCSRILEDVEDMVKILQSVNTNDVANLKRGFSNIIKQLSIITGIQIEQENRLDVIGQTMVASFSDMYTTVKKLQMSKEAEKVEKLIADVTELYNRVAEVSNENKTQSKKIEEIEKKVAKLSKNHITLIKNVKSLIYFTESNTSLIATLNNSYYTIKTEIKNKFTTVINMVEKSINNGKVSQKALEEFACWTQHDLEELNKLVNALMLQVTEIQSSTAEQTQESEEEQDEHFAVPMSVELKTLIKSYKNYVHAIHRALLEKSPLPTEAPKSMKGKKTTQEEIASKGGKNMDFSSKGMFKKEVLEICEKSLSKRDYDFVERVLNIELTKQEETDLEALIGLVQKACINYNKTSGVGI